MDIQHQRPVIAAIVSAVTSYIALEEEEAERSMSLPTGEASRPASSGYWAMSGRQATMDMRRLLQMRMVR